MISGTLCDPVRLDHLLTYVTSLDAAANLFARMGFTLSPRSSLESMGLSNHLVLMNPLGPGRANYLELMSPHDPGKLNAIMQRVLSGPPGIRSMVLASDTIETFHRRMGELGFLAPEPLRARREWKIPGEPSVFPEFDVVLPVEAPLRFNACRYHNVELYLRPDWRVHANGALRIVNCFGIADRPAELASYAELFGQGTRRLPEGDLCFPTGEIDLVVLTPESARRRFDLDVAPSPRPCYLGYEILVKSLAHLQSHLESNGVPFRSPTRIRSQTQALLVMPEVAFGNLICFTEENS